MSNALEQHLEKRETFRRQFLESKQKGRTVALGKKTSNLFRERKSTTSQRLDARSFNQIIDIDRERLLVDVEGMTTYESLVAGTLPHGFMPAVVPELKTITIGGAVSGGGIESSSFKYGFVHETIEEMDILTGTGDIVTCRADNEHRDLFYGFASSYGTLGYVMRLKAQIIPVKPYVRLQHTPFTDLDSLYSHLAQACAHGRIHADGPHFVEASVFGEKNCVLSLGYFTDEAPYLSNYTRTGIYYRSLTQRREDYLTVLDYIWRWDPDWFWCSKPFGAQFLPLRLILSAAGLLRSSTYWKIRSFIEKHPRIKTIALRGESVEWVIQDVEIPLAHAPEFHTFLLKEIGILPFWICPAQSPGNSAHFSLYTTDPGKLYTNFGFWGGVPNKGKPEGYFNRMVEEKVRELHGKKSLYSSSYYSEETFWELYNKPAYDALKNRYDPDRFFKNLYQKCVQGH